MMFRAAFNTKDDSYNDYEIVMDNVEAQDVQPMIGNGSLTYFKDHHIEIRIKQFETDDSASNNLFLKEQDMKETKLISLGFNEIQVESHLNKTIVNGVLNKTLETSRTCSFMNNKKFVCRDLRLIGGRSQERKSFQIVQISIKANQRSPMHSTDATDLQIISAHFSLQSRSVIFELYFTMIKYLFVVAIAISYCSFRRAIKQFHRNDVGIVQKYIESLMLSLFLFNDPMGGLFMANRNLLYSLVQSVCESFFIALLFFFWLMLLHSIAQQDNIITIGWRQFYFPKVFICCFLWLYLVTMRLYVYISYSQDPFFELFLQAERFDGYFRYLQSFGLLVITLYLVYFVMILAKALVVIKTLKKTYRYSLALTMFTLATSLTLMYNNGQASQRMDPPLFLSLLSLYNFYVILVGFLYTPMTGDGNEVEANNDIPAAEKERR